MSFRIFRANDGSCWTVWHVRAGSAANVPGMPLEWLAFQSEDGSERRRLLEIPPTWSGATDQRLDLLRRMADPVTLFAQRHSPPEGVRAIRVVGPDSGEE